MSYRLQYPSKWETFGNNQPDLILSKAEVDRAVRAHLRDYPPQKNGVPCDARINIKCDTHVMSVFSFADYLEDHGRLLVLKGVTSRLMLL
jgi:hypothetical protein